MLQRNEGDIRVTEYITQQLTPELLRRWLQQAGQQSRKQLALQAASLSFLPRGLPLFCLDEIGRNRHNTLMEEEVARPFQSHYVFADIGMPDPQQELTKARLAACLWRLITAKGLSQKEVLQRLGIEQPKVSALLRSQWKGYSRIACCVSRTPSTGKCVLLWVNKTPQTHRP